MLYIVATPIGNLKDITYRAIDILKSVDIILCEDTRVTRKLLSRYNISTPTKTLHQHTKKDQIKNIAEKLSKGENMALVTDAGTPGISDPGNQLVQASVECNVVVSPIPGASAVTAIASVAGIDMQRFIFLAYPPHKKGRQTFFKKMVKHIQKDKMPVIYYDSVHRVVKNLKYLAETESNLNIIVGRELTKKFEEIIRGDINSVIEYFEKSTSKIKGEFVIIAR